MAKAMSTTGSSLLPRIEGRIQVLRGLRRHVHQIAASEILVRQREFVVTRRQRGKARVSEQHERQHDLERETRCD